MVNLFFTMLWFYLRCWIPPSNCKSTQLRHWLHDGNNTQTYPKSICWDGGWCWGLSTSPHWRNCKFWSFVQRIGRKWIDQAIKRTLFLFAVDIPEEWPRFLALAVLASAGQHWRSTRVQGHPRHVIHEWYRYWYNLHLQGEVSTWVIRIFKLYKRGMKYQRKPF